MNSTINIKRTQSSDNDFNNLIRQLDIELHNQYQEAQAEYDNYNKIELIDTVIVAYDNEQPVGCGCFKVYNTNTVEIKRMFVDEKHRGLGISKMVLNELEKWAIGLGYSKAILETGVKQHEAIGLYNRTGYVRTGNYGQYKDNPNSVCFEKRLI